MKYRTLNFYRTPEPLNPVEDRGVQDLIRYDTAFWHPAFPDLVAFADFDCGFGKPTFGRWRSRLIELKRDVEPDRYPLRDAITYQHPQVGLFEGLDYAKLVEVKFSAFLEAKDIQAIRYPLDYMARERIKTRRRAAR